MNEMQKSIYGRILSFEVFVSISQKDKPIEEMEDVYVKIPSFGGHPSGKILFSKLISKDGSWYLGQMESEDEAWPTNQETPIFIIGKLKFQEYSR